MSIPSLTFDALRSEYADLWSSMVIRDDRLDLVKAGATHIVANKSVYETVERSTGVPWYVVGVIHKMESNCHMGRHLHNGDSLARRTIRVPRGRPTTGNGPFTWHESAIDALTMKGYQHINDWSIERICWCLERYNGWGYRKYHRETLSPYLWSYTTHYRSGKYVADGKWSASAVSSQAGAMPVLKVLLEWEGVTTQTPVPPLPVPAPTHEPIIVADEDEAVAAEPPAVQEAARESKTVLGGLVAAGGAVIGFFQDTVSSIIKFSGDWVGTMSELGSVKMMAATLGANVDALGLGLGLSGVAIVIVRRLDAARQGKIG